MELLKNKLCFIIKKIGSSKWSLLIIFLFLSLVLLHLLTRDVKDEIVEQKTSSFSISKDKDFLSCVYSQLICYNERAGEERSVILNSCGDIQVCDTLK